MAHTSVAILCHAVFSTKNRWRSIGTELQTRLWAYMGGIARQNGMLATVAYISAQQEHPKRIDFQQEFLSVLKKNGVQYDEHYLWGRIFSRPLRDYCVVVPSTRH